ncbi:unnamed protein product [Prunus armeniaca]
MGNLGEEVTLPHTSYIDKDADEVVTFKFFHGGKLVQNGSSDSEWSYFGGDYMSILELFGMAKDVGYDGGYGVSFYGEERSRSDSSLNLKLL